MAKKIKLISKTELKKALSKAKQLEKNKTLTNAQLKKEEKKIKQEETKLKEMIKKLRKSVK